jgi:hypothetical protein
MYESDLLQGTGLADAGYGIVADCDSAMLLGIAPKPGMARRAINEYVVVAVTVTVLFVLDAGELAVAVTESASSSAWVAADRLVQHDGTGRLAFELNS